MPKIVTLFFDGDDIMYERFMNRIRKDFTAHTERVSKSKFNRKLETKKYRSDEGWNFSHNG